MSIFATLFLNIKQLRLCLFLVCVVDENYPTIGLGGYVISVDTAFVHHVSPVINVQNVLGAG